MVSLLRILTKIYHYSHPVIGFCGLTATVVLYSPGTHLITVGPMRLDVFYIVVIAFGSLLILSAIDKYDPEEYGLGSSKADR